MKALILCLAATTLCAQTVINGSRVISGTVTMPFASTFPASGGLTIGTGSSVMNYGGRTVYRSSAFTPSYTATDPTPFYTGHYTQVTAQSGGLFSASSQTPYPSAVYEVIMRTKGQTVGGFYNLLGLGLGNNIVHNATVSCYGGSAVDSDAQCGAGELDIKQGDATGSADVFSATITGSPASGATTISYTSATNEGRAGERDLLNRSRKTTSTGTITTITVGTNETTFVFSGAPDFAALTPSVVDQYLIVGDTDDFYTGPCSGNAVTASSKCVNVHWRIKAVVNATTIKTYGEYDTANLTAAPASYSIFQGALVSGVDVTAHTLTIPSNSYSWANGDTVYETPSPHVQMLGVYLIMQKLFPNQGRDTMTGAHISSVGTSAGEYGVNVVGKWLTGYAITSGSGMRIGMDMTGSGGFSDAAMKLPCSNAAFKWGSAQLYCDGTGLRMSNRLVLDSNFRQGATSILDATDQTTYSEFGTRSNTAFYLKTNNTVRCGINSAGTLLDCTGGGQTVDFMARSWLGNGGFASAVTTQTINYAAANSTHWIFADTTGGVRTETLPGSPNNGQEIWVRRVAGSNNVVVDGNGKSIMAKGGQSTASTQTITDDGSYGYKYDGSRWIGL